MTADTFLGRHLIPYDRCTLNCAGVPEEVRLGTGLSRDTISELAAAEPIGCDGLTFLPYLAGVHRGEHTADENRSRFPHDKISRRLPTHDGGHFSQERTPNWPNASGAMVGLRAGHLARPGLLYRASLEAIAFSLRDGLEAMRRASDMGACDEIR